MNRITENDLKAVLNRINKQAGFDNPKYSEVGSYTIDYAYGGVRLDQFVNDRGGVNTITNGYCSKRELYHLMQAYLRGMETVNQ